MSDDSQDQLILLALEGDPSALERLLFENYSTLARHIAAKIPAALQKVVGVDDVLSQTFFHAFRDFPNYEHRSAESFQAWLKTIAEHRLADAIKGERRQKRGGHFQQVRAADDGRLSTIQDFVELLPDSGPTASRIAAKNEAEQALQVALASLPDNYQEAVRRHYLQGQPVEDVAREMGRTPALVRGLIDRAKKNARRVGKFVALPV